MAAAFTQFHASAVQAPGGFWLQIGLDNVNKLFKLNDKGVSINDHPSLSDITHVDNLYAFEFHSHINQDPAKPCHVKLQIRTDPKPSKNAVSWLVTAPDEKVLMDSGGFVLGNYGVKLEVK